MSEPIFFRLPKPGAQDPHFGCSRSWWNSKVLPCEANGFKPPIKSMAQKKPGAVKGIRLIHFESAKAWFAAELAKTETPNGTLAHDPNTMTISSNGNLLKVLRSEPGFVSIRILDAKGFADLINKIDQHEHTIS